MSIDHKASIIVLGESGVGKTSILLRFTRGSFKETTLTASIVDLLHAQLTVKNKKVRLDLWDTGGQDRFRTIVRQYYRKADGVLLIYDVTDISTFHKLSSWLAELRENNEDAVVVIVGNKTDHPDNKAVALNAVRRFAENENLEFFQTSAKTGENVYQIFEHLTFKVLQKRGVFPPPTPPPVTSPSVKSPEDMLASEKSTEQKYGVLTFSEVDDETIKLDAEPQAPKESTCCG